MSFDHHGLGDESRRAFARLTAIAAANEAMIRADPIPHLTKASEIIARQQHLIHALHDALTGSDLLFDAAMEYNVPPRMLNGEHMIRNQAALKLINEYFGI